MITSMQLKEVPIGQTFMHDYKLYMRIKDISNFKKSYPDAVAVLCLDDYELMLMSELYEVEVMDNIMEVDYE